MTGKRTQAERSVALLDQGATANRIVATADGATLAMQQASSAMLERGVAVRSASLVVAASDASAQLRATADYLCDGVADEVEINAAIASLALFGGTVLLSEGTFTLAAPVLLTTFRVALRGLGIDATTLRVVNVGGAAVNATIVSVAADYCELSGMTIDGNKANNAAQTGMVPVTVGAANAPALSRVRVVNSAGYGLVTSGTTVNGVIRDCVVEGSAVAGFVPRASAGQPLVVSGCTAKGNVAQGFICDNGPVVLSDCVAQANGSGFLLSGSSQATLGSCVAQAHGSVGFETAAGRTQFVGCRSVGNTDVGFQVGGSQAQLIGCSSVATTGSSIGYRTIAGGADALYSGCSSVDNATGFLHDAASIRSLFVGCRAVNSGSYSIRVVTGEIQVRDCTVIGTNATAGHGIILEAGTRHAVTGCHVTAVAGYGILANTNAADALIAGNHTSSIGLAANNTYPQIDADGDTCFVDGNVARDPPSGNRSAYGVLLGSNADRGMLGHNDARGAGVSGQVVNQGTNPRRLQRLLLDYVASTDLLNAAVSAGNFFDACPDQTFTVSSRHSLVEIAVGGTLLVGAASVGTEVTTRLAIDNAIGPMLGGDVLESASYYCNPLSGGTPIKIQGLAVGAHTVRLQFQSFSAATAYLRAATAPGQERLQIQVTEYLR